MKIINVIKNYISYDEYLNYHNILIINENLTNNINGFIYYYKDYNIIIINSILSDKEKKYTILHELAHFELNHLENDKKIGFSIKNIEDEADFYLKKILEDCNGNI